MIVKRNKKESGNFNSKPFLSKEGVKKLRAGEAKRRAYAAKTLKKLDRVLPPGTCPGLTLKAANL